MIEILSKKRVAQGYIEPKEGGIEFVHILLWRIRTLQELDLV